MNATEDNALTTETLESSGFLPSASTLHAPVTDTVKTSDRLLTSLLETIEGFVAVLDRAGNVRLLGQAGVDACGYARSEVRGRSWVEVLLFPEDRDQVRRTLDALWDESHEEASASVRFEAALQTKEGERRPFRFSARRITARSDDSSDASINPSDERSVDRTEDGMIVTGVELTRERALQREMVEADERERRRFGQDLHDMLASHLAGTAVMSSALCRKAEDDDADVRVSAKEMRRLTELVREAMEQVRALSHSYVAPELEGHGLVNALLRLAERTEEAARIACTCDVDASARDVSPTEEVATHLYRIAQEAVSNAISHGDPTEVEITLRIEGAASETFEGRASDLGHVNDSEESLVRGEAASVSDRRALVEVVATDSTPSKESQSFGAGRLVLMIRDDGRGLPADATVGVGLGNMRRRAQLIGAALRVGRAVEGGTLVRCGVPLPGSSETL